MSDLSKGVDQGLEATLGDCPIEAFLRWYEEAAAAQVPQPDAMCLSTAGLQGAPSSRMVLLKEVADGQFIFYTNQLSQKGREIRSNPLVSIVFFWAPLGRQVRVEGTAAALPESLADAYFATRPRESQIGAWISPQSTPLASRGELFRLAQLAEVRFPGDVPRPQAWGGYSVEPHRIEFWQAHPARLNDRLLFVRANDGGWNRGLLYP